MSKVYMSNEVVNILVNEGWMKVRMAGSQSQYKHPNKPGKVIYLPDDGNKIISNIKRIFQVADLEV